MFHRRSRSNSAFLAIAGIVLLISAVAAQAHSKAFWKDIIDHKFAVPEGATAPMLARELSDLLGSSDPELRDEFGYTILTNWIYSQKLLQPSDVRALMAQWTTNLTVGAGVAPSDGVFRRSFSALMLSVVVARDNAEPFLNEAEVRSLLGAALTYLSAERDVRGYDPKVGWMHSAAHTADLIKFLGRSRFITSADQGAILNAVSAKLAGTAEVFTHGEDERMARAVLSIVHRGDFDEAGFEAWLKKTKPSASTGPLDPGRLHGDQNVKNLFAKLEVVLSLESDPPSAIRAATDSLRAALKTMF